MAAPEVELFAGQEAYVELAYFCYDNDNHLCKFIHTVVISCGIKGLLISEKVFLPTSPAQTSRLEKFRNNPASVAVTNSAQAANVAAAASLCNICNFKAVSRPEITIQD